MVSRKVAIASPVIGSLSDRYGRRPVLLVGLAIYVVASIAAAFAGVPSGSLMRRGRRSNGSVFTVETLGLYFVHDPVHHLHDVSRLPAD